MEPIFYVCEKDGAVASVFGGSVSDLFCGGEPMIRLIPNTSEGAQEKHLPVVEQQGSELTVKVGSVFHPMSQEHSIQWVCLETVQGMQIVSLPHDGEPVARFALAQGDRAVAAYAYCNLHGFWKTQL